MALELAEASLALSSLRVSGLISHTTF